LVGRELNRENYRREAVQIRRRLNAPEHVLLQSTGSSVQVQSRLLWSLVCFLMKL
jgi:hypothetical protein